MVTLRQSFAFAALALLAVASARAADREARQWLERMSESLATRNYEGRFFHLRDSESKAMRIIHRVERGKVTERVVSLDGSGREIIRNQSEVIFY
jgi:sigma-E factor negative regulatory protein RseB